MSLRSRRLAICLHIQEMQYSTVMWSPFVTCPASFPQEKSIGQPDGKVASHSSKSLLPSSRHPQSCHTSLVTHACSLIQQQFPPRPEIAHMHHSTYPCACPIQQQSSHCSNMPLNPPAYPAPPFLGPKVMCTTTTNLDLPGSSHLPACWPACKLPGTSNFLPVSPLTSLIGSQQEVVWRS